MELDHTPWDHYYFEFNNSPKKIYLRLRAQNLYMFCYPIPEIYQGSMKIFSLVYHLSIFSEYIVSIFLLLSLFSVY